MIEDQYMDQTEKIETNQEKSKIQAGYVETKDHEKPNKSPRRVNEGRGVDCLKMKFGGKTYDTQITTSTGEKKNIYV